MMKRNSTLTAIRGVRVGNAQDLNKRTGTTVVLFDHPVSAFADHRGGWPGSFDSAASNLGKTFVKRHALFMTGGDVYGYDAAAGIRKYLLEHRFAAPRGAGKMPAIMGTNIYDLEFAHPADYETLGYHACEEASSRPVRQGNVGVGIGATVGPFFGSKGGTKGGLGSSATQVRRWTVGAMVVTNCVGNVFDPFVCETIAGTRRPNGWGFLEMNDVLDEYITRSTTRSGTTIGVVGTDAPLDHEQLARLVELVHDGIALAVRPSHMSTDGDTILGFCTGDPKVRRLDYRVFDAIHHRAILELARAAVNSILHARTLGGVPAYSDLHFRSRKRTGSPT